METSGCGCRRLENLAVVPMGMHNVFQTLDVVRRRGVPWWWLSASRCSACNQMWLVAQEELYNDLFVLRRLDKVAADWLLGGDVWPSDFDRFEAVLEICRAAGIEPPTSIRELLARRFMDAGYATQFADALCQCGQRVFTLEVDEVVGEACWFCQACEAVYLLHDAADESYAGSPNSDPVDCVCRCEQSRFEIVVGVTLYGQTDTARTAYIGCRCVACGLMGCYASWPRVDMPYSRFFSSMRKQLRD